MNNCTECNPIAQCIKSNRNRLNITQKELAQKSGISEASIKKYESGSRFPKIEQISKIATVFGISVQELLYGKMHMKNPENERIEILHSKDVMAQGFGFVPRIVIRDKKLSIEGKAIYVYLSSFAGIDNQVFFSRDLVLNELNITEEKYLDCIKLLQTYGYIKTGEITGVE